MHLQFEDLSTKFKYFSGFLLLHEILIELILKSFQKLVPNQKSRSSLALYITAKTILHDQSRKNAIVIYATLCLRKCKLFATLRSLLNELACLTIVTIVKQASSFDRDLRVCDSDAKIFLVLYPLLENSTTRTAIMIKYAN